LNGGGPFASPGLSPGTGRARRSAIARHFPASLCLPLDAALALYKGMANKTPGLTLQTRNRTPIYSDEVARIIAGQSAFSPSGYSMRGDSLDAVSGFIRDAGISRVLEFGPGVSTLVLPRLFEGQIERYVCIEENLEYAANLMAAFAGRATYDAVSIQCLELSEEKGPEVNRHDTGPFRAASFLGLSEAVKSAFGAQPPGLVLIDGPSRQARWGRFAALADLMELLPPGTVILLDDALRYREVSILDEWRSRELVEVDGIFCLGTGLAVARVI
jgi:predicted O-methyltransferase YrrM